MRIVKWRSSVAYWTKCPPFETRACFSNGVAHVSPSQRCKWPDRSRVRFLFKFALEVRTQVRTSPHQHPLAWTLQAYWSVLARTWVATSNQMQNVFDFKNSSAILHLNCTFCGNCWSNVIQSHPDLSQKFQISSQVLSYFWVLPCLPSTRQVTLWSGKAAALPVSESASLQSLHFTKHENDRTSRGMHRHLIIVAVFQLQDLLTKLCL